MAPILSPQVARYAASPRYPGGVTAVEPNKLTSNGEVTASRDPLGAFCWSKYGTEAGEGIDRILARKEEERVRNGGLFLWGIGNSIRPALRELVDKSAHPPVRFSAMKSRPKPIDVFPERVVKWRSGVALDGSPYDLPPGSIVTSRASAAAHFALVCWSVNPLVETTQEINAGWLRNYIGGTRVGHSQVTSVVSSDVQRPADGVRYDAGFSATLVPPFLVQLTAGEVLDVRVPVEASGSGGPHFTPLPIQQPTLAGLFG